MLAISIFNVHATKINASALAQYKTLISASIKQFEDTQRDKWSYKVHRMENEEGNITDRIELFTPHQDKSKQWSLLELNGRKPTLKQQEEFIQSRLEITKSQGQGDTSFAVQLSKLIDMKSLTLLRENTNHAELAFDVHIEKLGDDAKGKLDGLLTFNKQQQFIDSIEIRNNSDFSPMFSASISNLKINMKFHKLAQSILPLENSMLMQGTFAFFTEIDETSSDQYSEFHYRAANNP